MYLCPCNSSKHFDDCCGRYLNGAAKAPTAEALMRSRYSAFALHQLDYILQTMKPPAAEQFNWQEVNQKPVKWIKLEVLNTQTHGDKAWVEFIAYYVTNDKQHFLHEKSEFHLIDLHWYYVDGELQKSNHKIGRNDFCYCGSQIKFKKCCGK